MRSAEQIERAIRDRDRKFSGEPSGWEVFSSIIDTALSLAAGIGGILYLCHLIVGWPG